MNDDLEPNPGSLQAALYEAYNQSLNDKCRMRYIDTQYRILPGKSLLTEYSTFICAVHAIRQ